MTVIDWPGDRLQHKSEILQNSLSDLKDNQALFEVYLSSIIKV